MKQLWMVVVVVAASGCYTRATGPEPASATPHADEDTWEPSAPDPSWDYLQAQQQRSDDTPPAPAPDYTEQNRQIQEQQDAIYQQAQQQLEDYNNAILSEPVPGPETLAPPPPPPTFE